MKGSSTSAGQADSSAKPRLAGREAELAQLSACMQKVRAEEPWLVDIEGEPGIGKSTLVRAFTVGIKDLTVLWAGADQHEEDYPYGVLGQLLTRLDPATASQFPLLSAVVSPPPAPHAAAAQLLELLGQLQTAGPVAVVIDDMQWADEPSLEALTFAVKRLWADQVVIILTHSQNETNLKAAAVKLAGACERICTIRLEGLSPAEAAVMAENLGASVRPDVLARLQQHTGGHPLYLHTLLTELSPGELQHPAQGSLPVPASLRASISMQLAHLPAPTRRLLDALAVLNAPATPDTVSRLAELETLEPALEPALSLGLVRWHPSGTQQDLVLCHALQQEILYALLNPSSRRRLHAAAASLVDTTAAWAHRTAAVSSTDPVLADELEAVARREAAQGQNTLAATHLSWAADISNTREERERRLLSACAQSLLTMRSGWAANQASQVEACTPCPMRSCVLGILAMLQGRHAEAEDHLTQAWSAPPDPKNTEVGVLAGTFLAVLHLWHLRGKAAVDTARETLHRYKDHPLDDYLHAVVAMGRSMHEGAEAALTGLHSSVPEPPSPSAPAALDTAAFTAVLRLMRGELTAAQADLTAIIDLERSGAAPLRLSQLSTASLALSHYWLGSWNEAAATAERVVSMADTEVQLWYRATAHMTAACVPAGRGEWERAARHIAVLQEIAQTIDTTLEWFHLGLASAVVAHARGDSAALLQGLAPLDSAALNGLDLPWQLWCEGLRIDGLIGCRELSAAADALEDLRPSIAGNHRMQAVFARLNGLLEEQRGNLAEALSHYREGLALPPHPDDSPLDQGLLAHSYGRLLLTSGAASHSEAARWLSDACSRFSALGAEPYLQRAQNDLAACGVREMQTTAAAPLAQLTERESAVAVVVARGLTNAEAARELYVSQKTVECHLSHVYAKLGIKSRRELKKLFE
ncbi:hypothetical protein ADK75_03900 [Streptomyces virginiae]|uniref:HTH luxR-type domain-containing protein n=1 Tax=Streptomyces virginiae TaxID=1961 RepID=A0A0L8N496_STRVG|nr:LuxR family transcriptional regulator [Streptomyces virginiae]KOG57496.1 hypothetical protein ADK75_03900 [Streptomyces virginiae]